MFGNLIRAVGIGRLGAIVAALLLSFFGALWAMDALFPSTIRAPVMAQLPQLPPLPPASRASTIVAPAAISLAAIRDALEAQAPRNLSGKRDNPLTELLGKADIGWTVTRSPLTVTGRAEGLSIATTISGALRITGTISDKAGNVGGALGGLLGSNVGRVVQNVTGKTLDQRADVRGNVSVMARPSIGPNWRIEPNLAAQVTMGDSALSVAGIKLNVVKEVKPLLDKQVNEQVANLGARIRNDPFLEQAARREWAKMCRSISLKGIGDNAPDLWLEVKPVRAYAAQPRIDTGAVVLTMGVEADTRVVPQATQPICPFPDQLALLPQQEQGQLAIGLPIDLPFTEVNKMLEPRIKGRSFPEDGGGPVAITVLSAKIAPAGDRLLISLRVKAREQKTFFGFGAEADIFVWGKPVLDEAQQVLRLTDIDVDVQSQAAFGLLGAAAKAAQPLLEKALADNAVIDLKPFAASARASIGAAIADFRKSDPAYNVDADITNLRLAGIAYDSKTLRIITEAEGTARVAVTSLR